VVIFKFIVKIFLSIDSDNRQSLLDQHKTVEKKVNSDVAQATAQL